jgi:hypothetical protein
MQDNASRHRIVRAPIVFEGSHECVEGMATSEISETGSEYDMRRFKTGRCTAVSVSILASAALALSLVSQAAAAKGKSAAPLAITNPAQHVLSTSALLGATIDPNGKATSYFFQYGPTTAYGLTTPTVSVGSGTSKVRVGQIVSRLLPNAVYHYRVVATSSAGTTSGRDRTFGGKGTKLGLQLTATPKPDVFGGPLVISGKLSGLGGSSHRIVLQSSPFPYLEAFRDVTPPTLTDAVGAFSFTVPSLLTSTQFRVMTLDPRPLLSHVLTENVAVHVTFHVRSSGRLGLVRLYGSVSPAAVGAHVSFQLQKPVRPGRSGKSVKAVTEFGTVVKKGTRTSSRFSLVVTVRQTGRYRAFVIMPKGPFVSGPSQTTILLHAAPSRKGHKRH